MKKTYQIVTRAARESAAVIEQFCKSNGQILLPMLNLLDSASQIVEGAIHEIGARMIEQILVLSAGQIAGSRTPGKASGDIRYHGTQNGTVQLADRKLRVTKPRLRHRTEGEVKVPAYEALRGDRGAAQHVWGTMLRGVSTREYAQVLPEMAATVGVSKSAVSRKAVEASIEQLKQLQGRRWENIDMLVIYIDGQRFGDHHMLSAVGISGDGRKHIMGVEPGATENAAAVKRLLCHLREHGLNTDRQYLFVIDGAKALRAGIEEVFGAKQPVQRCRNHKMRNVTDELPKELHTQTLSMLRAAWKAKTAKEGIEQVDKLARFLEQDHPSAARSLREGLPEMFTLQRLKIPPSLHKCLATTNIIESAQSGVGRRTHNVSRWRDEDMAHRWVASAWMLTETNFRRVAGHEDLWSLAAILGRETAKAASVQENVA